jgi:diketogulonate reductase-like aldo/keto reductase
MIKLENRICLGFNNPKNKKLNVAHNKIILKNALKLGLNCIDIADSYYNGSLLKFIGNNLNNSRKNIFIINKFQLTNKKEIIQNLDKSLKTLKLDYLDLYMPHWPNPNFPQEELALLAEKFVKEGKIKYFGLSNYNLNLIKKFIKIYPHRIFLQNEININNYYSMSNIISYSQKKNINIFSYQINNNFPSNKKNINLLLKKKNLNSYEFSLKWIKSLKNVIPIIRTGNLDNLRKNFKIMSKKSYDMSNPKVYCYKNFKDILISKIIKISSESDTVYNSLNEAKINKKNLFPSPVMISKEIKKFGLLKPFNLERIGKNYHLVSGQARFWAYQIAYKNIKKIPAIILK